VTRLAGEAELSITAAFAAACGSKEKFLWKSSWHG
jgi:hypothetical protein